MQALRNNNDEMARSEAPSLKDIYKDNFYMGIQLLGHSQSLF